MQSRNYHLQDLETQIRSDYSLIYNIQSHGSTFIFDPGKKSQICCPVQISWQLHFRIIILKRKLKTFPLLINIFYLKFKTLVYLPFNIMCLETQTYLATLKVLFSTLNGKLTYNLKAITTGNTTWKNNVVNFT